MSCSRFLYACAVTAGCVVGAIVKQMAVLAPNAPNEERLKALKYLVQFVADVHQPPHASESAHAQTTVHIFGRVGADDVAAA